jgi:hypothetical protein
VFAALVKGGGNMYLMNLDGRTPIDIGFYSDEDEKTKREMFGVWWEERFKTDRSLFEDLRSFADLSVEELYQYFCVENAFRFTSTA